MCACVSVVCVVEETERSTSFVYDPVLSSSPEQTCTQPKSKRIKSCSKQRTGRTNRQQPTAMPARLLWAAVLMLMLLVTLLSQPATGQLVRLFTTSYPLHHCCALLLSRFTFLIPFVGCGFFFPTARAFSAFVLCQCRLRSAAASTLCLKTACRCCSQCRVLDHVPVSLVPSTCRYDQRLHGTAAKQPKASNQKQASKHHYLVLTHVPVSLLCRASHQTQARATLLCPRHPSCCRQHPPGSFKSTCDIVCLLVS